VGIAAVAVVGASITAADARIPGVGNGIQVTTDAPDLRTVKIVDNDLKRVQYCYDQPINGTPAANRFILQTYDANRFLQGQSVAVDADSQSCARVTFAGGADLQQATIGTDISGGAVDASNRPSTIGTEPLGGSGATPMSGRTTAPDLVSAAIDGNPAPGGAGGTIRYTFDEAIDPALVPVAANFRFYDEAGNTRVGTAVVSRDANSVRVAFASPVSTGARAFALGGAVRDVPQSGNVTGGSLTTDSGADAVALGGRPTARRSLASRVVPVSSRSPTTRTSTQARPRRCRLSSTTARRHRPPTSSPSPGRRTRRSARRSAWPWATRRPRSSDSSISAGR